MVYTVIGLRDAEGRLTVAGVVPGEVELVDADPGANDAQRWADSFEADDPDHAERLAHEACEED
jgi:hypothetical protein